MQAADIMTRHVFTIHREDPLEHAIRLMLQYGISGLPVIDDQGQVVGMLTEGDLLRRSELHTERRRPRWLEFLIGPGKLAEEYVHTHSLRIRDVMSSQVVTVAPDTALTQVV
jgi:CBS domain-containing protein